MSKSENTAKLNVDLNDLNKAFREATQNIKLANSEFRAATSGLDKWASSADGVSAKIKQLNTVLDAEKTKLQVLEQKYQKVVEKQGASSDEAKRLAVQINNQKARIGETEKNLKKYSDELYKLGTAERDAAGKSEIFIKSLADVGDEADEAKSRLAKAADTVKNKVGKAADFTKDKLEKIAPILEKGLVGAAKVAGKAVLAIGTAAVGAGAASVKAGADFDAQMSTVKAISGATEEEFSALQEKAKEMGATTSFSATESAKALEYMAMAGWKTSDMIDGLPAIMDAAAASGEELGTVSDIITDGLTAFGLQAADSSHFADVLAAASSNANTNIGMMGETFKYVAPMAGALKYSVDDVAVGIGLMANSGIKAEQAGTSLRGILANLASPTDKVSRAMDDLGISLTDSEGNAKTFDEVLENMRSSFARLDDTEKAEYATRIAGKNAMSGMLALVNASEADYNKLSESIANADGAAKKMAETRLDNLTGDVTLFKSALEGAEIAISDQISPALRSFVQEGTALIPELQGEIADLGGNLAGFATDLLPTIKDIVKASVPVMSEVMGVIKNIMPYVKDVVKSLLPVAQKLISGVLKVVEPIVKNVLPPLSRLIEQVAKVLDGLLTILEPVLTIISNIASLIVGGLVDALAAMISAFTGGSRAVDKAKEKFSALSKAEQENIDKLEELKAANEDAEQARRDSIEGIQAEYGYYGTLFDELTRIVDENGKVKKGYEDRATVITTTLSEALGEEIKITDGVIEKYGELKDKIEDVIKTKTGEAVLSANEDAYTDAISRQSDALKGLTEAQDILSGNEQKLSDIQKEKLELERDIREGREADYARLQELTGAESAYKDKILSNKNAIKEFKEEYATSAADISNYTQLQQDVLNGNTDLISRDIQMMKDGFLKADSATKDMVTNRVAEYKRMWRILHEQNKAGGTRETLQAEQNYKDMYYAERAQLAMFPGMNAEAIDAVLSTFEDANYNFANAGISNASAYGNALINGLESLRSQAVTTAQTIADDISLILSAAQSELEMNSKVTVTTSSSKKTTATGGIVTRAQTRLVGEDGAEAIIPLEKNTGWIDRVAERITLGTGGKTMGNVVNNYNFNQTNNSPKALSRFEIYRQSKRLLSFK